MARTLLRDSDVYPVALRELSVLRVSDVNSRMRRVTLTGEQLRPFDAGEVQMPEFRSTGFDDHIKLYFPYPGSSEVLLPVQKAARLEFGSGQRPLPRSRVRVHYHGTLLDGTVFDSSYDRNQPAEFSLGQVIPGWTEGVALMPVGAKYRFWIPGQLGYGASGTSGGPIGPNATLVFDIELLDVL
ncbi:MAG: FKBP-type peptidyl-prolyl cis-trans isomerase [Luteimonas sp.]